MNNNNVTTIEISVENMPEDLKILFVGLIDLIMAANNMNFTKNVKVETVEEIVSTMEAFNGKG
jgi:ribosome biogenesis protein Tsr3